MILFIPQSGLGEELIYPQKKLLPVDDTDSSEDFAEFKEEFVERIRAKDEKYLLRHTAEDIKFNFGYTESPGKEGFIREWGLREAPDESDIWSEILEIIELGFVFREGTESFVGPYVYANFPDEFDSYQFAAITDKDVAVFAELDQNADRVKKLSYDIVKKENREEMCLNEEGEEILWQKIILPNGSEGYVLVDKIRSPLDYRMSIKRIDGSWKIKYFIAGD
jgi:hypothetical protein